MQSKNLKVAIVHDWLTARGGAEKVVLAIHELFPDSPIYTSAYNSKVLPEFAGLDVRTTFIQKIPFFNIHHKFAFLLRIPAFYHLDLSYYDLVISSTTAEAKGVKTKFSANRFHSTASIKSQRSGALHLCYCNTPTRYYWSGFEQYISEPGFGFLNPLARLGLKLFIKPLRYLDLKMSKRPDVYIGNSSAVSERIKAYYSRESYTLFPSVETERFQIGGEKERTHFIVAGRQVPYKRVDLAIEACTKLNLPLWVVGSGGEHEKLVSIAGPTIEFITDANDSKIAELYSKSKALLYPAEEDAGIVPVEAMAAGTPVIAYGKGGVLDSIVDQKTGILFNSQTVESLVKAIQISEKTVWNHKLISEHAQQFSKENFKKKLSEIIDIELRKELL